MAYKKLIKVSNVCQLLDKRKFLATQTINGVKFTNNGDGTITVNGTATGRTVFRFVFDRVIISKGAKLLFNNVLDAEAYNKFWVEVKLQYTDGTDKYIADVIITPSPPTKDVNEITGYIIVNDGETVNETLTPQLFGLTEMYGAGHEPTSVEQFRQDFPDEMYDYSPYCWLTSYKRVFMTGGGNYLTSYQRNLTCKTKNLFKASLIYLKPGVSVSGNSITYDGKSSSPSSSNLPVYLSLGTFSSLFSSLSVGETYTFSCTVVYDGENPLNDISFRVIIYNPNDPNFSIIYLVNPNQIGYCSSTFTVTEAFLDCHVIFYGYNSGIPCTWKNIMVNKGDTATDYIPYGHL